MISQLASQRVGIVSIYDNSNFGNRLQNLALQQAIFSLGLQPETIISEKFDQGNILQRLRFLFIRSRISPRYPIEVIKKVLTRTTEAADKSIDQALLKRQLSFKEFEKEFINISEARLFPSGLFGEKVENFHKIIVGSDQVWNPYYRIGCHSEFLSFAPKQNRIAYAASLGVANIPKLLIPVYRKSLLAFDQISVREDEAAKYLKNTLGVAAQVMPDPTLLLTSDMWRRYSRTHTEELGGEYVACYFLGKPDNEKFEHITSVCKSKGYRTLWLFDKRSPQTLDAGPAEFLSIIANSKFILTDSFHAIAFSLIFKKPFFAFSRTHTSGPSLDSRLHSILKKFSLTNRFQTSLNPLIDDYSVNYENIQMILNEERKRGMNFLSRAIA